MGHGFPDLLIVLCAETTIKGECNDYCIDGGIIELRAIIGVLSRGDVLDDGCI
jgi:hypothetical protein